MAWTENIKQNLSITTGDGKVYFPKWIPTEFTRDFNIASFEFPEVEGTLVYKSQPKGRVFPLRIYFDGENHLENASDFELSSRDKRAWKVSHPYYGNIVVQASSLTFNNESLNVTAITGDLLETIETVYPKGSVVAKDKIFNDIEETTELSAYVFSKQSKPLVKDIQPMQDKAKSLYESAQGYISTLSDGYSNAYRKATSGINSLTQTPMLAMQSVQSLITMPARFDEGVSVRFSILKKQFDVMQRTVTGNVLTLAQKYDYESSSGTSIMAMCLALSTPKENDLKTQKEVLVYVDYLLSMWGVYVQTIDSLQASNGGVIGGYVPSGQFLWQLFGILNFTISNLFTIANNALQERSFYLENDSNWILLAHRIYGLVEDDSTIIRIMAENNAKLNEYLIVRKGRKIVYYV